MKKVTALAIIFILTASVISGCSSAPGDTKEPQGSTLSTEDSEAKAPDSTQTTEAPATEAPASTQTTEAPAPTETQTNPAQATGTLFIGSNGNFKEYPFNGDKTPDHLIEAIADLTGWNLELADSVTDGKGGMTVCFTKNCAIFTGPPDPQKEDFFMYDSTTLAQTILDSIQKTLQENYVDRNAGGNPENLDIYFCMQDGDNITDIAVAESGIMVPMDHPYKGIMME